MRKLEARFHPKRSRRDFETVGYLVWRTEAPQALPVFEPVRSDSASVLSKINYFVSITQPDVFEGLQALHSEFWSFAPVAPEETSTET